MRTAAVSLEQSRRSGRGRRHGRENVEMTEFGTSNMSQTFGFHCEAFTCFLTKMSAFLAIRAAAAI